MLPVHLDLVILLCTFLEDPTGCLHKFFGNLCCLAFSIFSAITGSKISTWLTATVADDVMLNQQEGVRICSLPSCERPLSNYLSCDKVLLFGKTVHRFEFRGKKSQEKEAKILGCRGSITGSTSR